MRKYITLHQAAKLLPIKVSGSTVWRWCINGLSVPGQDEVIRLQFVSVGRRLFTTAEWLDLFVDELTAARLGHYRRRNNGRTDRHWQRAKELAEADEILRRAGI